ncbi:MAG: DUF547 domain-containing protein [Chloroflexi bacterium]|nr:DUF547 domain-containing protein [Chloroflexota bacterium]
MTRLHINRGFCALALGCAIIASQATAAEFDQTHALFTGVLTNFVKDTRVNYAALKAHPQDLNRYLDQIAAVSKAEFKKWNEPQQIAFLSNAYNAHTLRLIIDHYPLKSIKDIGSFLKGPWDQPVVKLFGETINLNTVEHKILRVDYAEPRLHFVLVCAAKGCPPLRSEAYVGARLEEQLVDQAKQYLAETAKNRVEAAEHTVFLSPIFKWYGSDFEKKSGSVLAALKPYWSGKSVAGYEEFTIRYTEYDWSLNEQPRK